jgi:hypothetical protein
MPTARNRISAGMPSLMDVLLANILAISNIDPAIIIFSADSFMNEPN